MSKLCNATEESHHARLKISDGTKEPCNPLLQYQLFIRVNFDEHFKEKSSTKHSISITISSDDDNKTHCFYREICI